MSRAYVTVLVGERPLVVVISDASVTSGPLREVLGEAKLDLEVISPQNAIEGKSRESLAAAYKIVWLCPLWTIEDIAKAGKQTQLLSILQGYQDRTVVVITQDTPTPKSLEHTFSQWAHVTQSQSKFKSWIAQYLSVPILSYFDIWSLEDGSSPSAVFDAIVSSQNQARLSDPQVAFYPQTWKSAVVDFAYRISKPLTEAQNIGGKRVASSVLVKLLVLHLQRLGSPLLEIVPRGEGDSEAQTKIATTLYVEGSDQLIESIVPTLKMISVKVNKIIPANYSHGSTASLSKTIPTPEGRNVSAASFETKPPQPLDLETPAPKTLKIPPKKDLKIEASHAASLGIPKTSQVTEKKTEIPPEIALDPVKTSEAPVIVEVKKTASLPPKPPTVTAQLISEPTPDSVTELDAELTHLFQKYRSLQKVEQVKSIATVTKTTNRRSLRKRKTFWLGLVLIAIGFGLASLFGLYLGGTTVLKNQVIAAVESNQTVTSTSGSIQFQPWLSFVRAQTSLFSLILPAQYTDTPRQTTQAAQTWINLNQNTADLNQASTNLVLAMTNRYPVDVSEQLSLVTTLSQSAYQDISQIQASLKQLQATQTETTALNTALAAINSQKRLLTVLQQLQPILGNLIGLEGKKTYAIVFQNDQELRPQGGLIQAVAFITLDNGMVVDTEVMSAAELDTSLVGVAQPPPELQRYLGGDHWAFRDSTWSGDGVASGQHVTTLLDRSTPFSIDGVIFVNSHVMQDWLKAIGPLDLPEFKEEITDRNLSARLEAHSELQVDPTKPDYFTALLETMIQKTLVTPETKIPQLLQAWGKNLEAQQMSIVLRRPEDLETVANLGWSGKLLTPNCPPQLQQEKCLVDTLAQVEANVGVNKVNGYISRDVKHHVKIDETQINHIHELTLTNKAASNSWPRGTYKSYVRFYIPVGAQSPAPAINGKAVPPGSFDSFVENGRQVVGVYVEVPIQEQTQIELAYHVPYDTTGSFSYALFTQFQPGITPPPYEVSIQAPGHQAVIIAPQAEVSSTGIVFTPPPSLSSLVGVKFE